jgi:PAS domain-containing protein
MTWNIAEDIAPLLGFATAMVAVLLIPVRPGGTFNRVSKGFFAASILCYLISTSANILSHFGLFPDVLDPAIVSIELLWVPFILFGVYSLYSNQQLNDAIASRHAVKKAGEMLESVMETAPAGIIVLSSAGRITFANGEARRLLDISDDGPDALMHSDWSVRSGDDAAAASDFRRDFRDLVTADPLVDVKIQVSWPNGWHRHLAVNTAPFDDGSCGVGGAVASFLECAPWDVTGGSLSAPFAP